MNKKIIAIAISVIMIFSALSVAINAEAAAQNSYEVVFHSEMTQDKWAEGAGWKFGSDGIFMKAGYNYDAAYPVYAEERPVNGVTMTFTIDDINAVAANANLMIASFCSDASAGAATGYCIDYYPSAGAFDINYGDKGIDGAIAKVTGYPYTGESMAVTAYITYDEVGVILNGNVILSVALNEGDKGTDFKYISSWQWESTAKVTSYAFAQVNVPVETTEEQTGAGTQSQTEEQTQQTVEKKGCFSSMALASVAVVAALGAFVIKKKEN